MSTLYVIAQLHRSELVARQALRSWRTDSDPTILHLNSSDRMKDLLRLIGDEHIVLNKDCFAIDSDDESACADFSAFLCALRMYEQNDTGTLSVIRSLSCRV